MSLCTILIIALLAVIGVILIALVWQLIRLRQGV